MEPRPVLRDGSVTVRPGHAGEVAVLHQILGEDAVREWWGEPDDQEEIADKLLGDNESVLLVVEVDGEVAGGIEYSEELTPMYRHAGIDIFLSAHSQGRGIGATAVRLLAGFLLSGRGHHRLTIDPAASNHRAIRCYEKVGFRPVGLMRQYEQGPDGTFHDALLMDLLRDELVTDDPAEAGER